MTNIIHKGAWHRHMEITAASFLVGCYIAMRLMTQHLLEEKKTIRKDLVFMATLAKLAVLSRFTAI